MAHWSENTTRLKLQTVKLDKIDLLQNIVPDSSTVVVLWFPRGKAEHDAKHSVRSFETIARYCSRLDSSATLCVLATPSLAATLLPFLQEFLKLQLWVAVKTVSGSTGISSASIPACHASLIVLTRYKAILRHVPTRIKYTYCPACGKTTKDYGGKEHMYHSYGTLMSDVWKDIECDPGRDITSVVGRLQDLFGMAPYERLLLIDLRECQELTPVQVDIISRRISPSKTPPSTASRTVRSRLINKDCIEGLRSLRSNSIDFSFADLPYNLKKRYYRCKDALRPDEYFQWCNEWLSELHRVLKPGRTLAVLNVPQWAAKHFSFLSSIEMDFQTWIVWDALGFPARKIMPAHYVVLCFSKGEPRSLPGLGIVDENSVESLYLRHRKELYCIRPTCVSQRRSIKDGDYSTLTDIWSDVHRVTHNSRRVNHPCQLPPLLMRRLFALFTKQGEVILDCFNGAGTSTLVAHQMSRNFVGIEISTRYHNLALKRHRLISYGEDPFGKRDFVPRAKNSRVLRLPKQKYRVTKKTLQLEVKRIAKELGRMPKREDVRGRSDFPMKYFDSYFSSWGEVCAAARADTLEAART